MPQALEITLEDTLALEREPAELRETLRQGLILLDYVHARISLGKLAELMGMKVQQAGEWLQRLGIPALRKLSDPSLENACAENAAELAQELGISRATSFA